jgi:hypothetical protein
MAAFVICWERDHKTADVGFVTLSVEVKLVGAASGATVDIELV